MTASPRCDPTVSLADKVAFLSRPEAYPAAAGPVSRRETHMSWVFFVGDAVYKLKKPIRLEYLDFSTLRRREAACRAEYALNQRLASGVYLEVAPLVRAPGGGLALGGQGQTVDWLVRMRRLDETGTLEARLARGDLDPSDLRILCNVLARFYRAARRVGGGPAARLTAWRRSVAGNRAVLLDPALGLPRGLVRKVLASQLRLLRRRPDLVAARVARRRILDGHGDLRPEHVWIGSPVKIIDRLEFSAALRAVDPLDEIAFLDLECERLGAPEVGRQLRRRVLAALGDEAPDALYLFYRSYRATLRARLSIAHLLEPEPRTPQKWPRQARDYLAIAARDARRLDVALRRPRAQ